MTLRITNNHVSEKLKQAKFSDMMRDMIYLFWWPITIIMITIYKNSNIVLLKIIQ